jgi:16S rRNA (cytosine967-C5)-methyltransferase
VDSITRLALDIIAQAGRDKPADGLLRARLRDSRMARRDAALVTELVFGFFRWKGGLNADSPPEQQLEAARRLEDRFRHKPESFSFEELRRAFPPWMGDEVVVSRELLAALQSRPPLWLRAKRGTGQTLQARLEHCERGFGWLEDALRYEGDEDLFRTPEFHAGEFEIQDVASQMVGLWCDPQPGQTWWDACAGEGGKLLHLSDLMQNKGLIWASDRADWRLKKLKQRAARARAFNYRAVLWDGGEKLPTKTRFDGVLSDAPCSGIGTWARNPHARWTTTPEDIRELAEIQSRLLRQAAAAVKPGGKLIYAVCTLARRETDAVADRGSLELSQFEPLSLSPSPGEPPGASSRKWIWPQQWNGNGMFAAAWRRLL